MVRKVFESLKFDCTLIRAIHADERLLTPKVTRDENFLVSANDNNECNNKSNDNKSFEIH